MKVSEKERLEAWEREVKEELRRALRMKEEENKKLMECLGEIKEEYEELHQVYLREVEHGRPLSVYSTGQLKEELRKRKRWT